MGAMVIHAAFALFSGDRLLPLPKPPQRDAMNIELLEPDELNVPGGGSETPGPEPIAKAAARVSTPKKNAPKPAKPKPAPEVVRAEPSVEKPAVDQVDDPVVDALLAEALSQPSNFTLPKPKAARTTVARQPQKDDTRSDANGKTPQNSAIGSIHRGTGPGRNGGPGGPGQGNGRVVTEKFAFGGPEGAFKADVCALPQGTASIGMVTECPHLLTFFADRINVSERHFKKGFPGIEDRVEWFGIKYTGQFKVKETGVYEFRLSSDDGSRLIIDDQLVINNDGTHAPLSRTGRIHLTAGAHQLKLLYFQGPGTLLALQLFVTPPGRGEKTFRPEF